MIAAEGLSKRFGSTQALDRVDLRAESGSVLAVLGHNGAGKSTAVRILTTLSRPDAGHAEVAGFDVARRPREVQRRIGVVTQDATVDEVLTGRQNLVMLGRLNGLHRFDAQTRASRLLAEFELEDAAGRMVKTYSGGMRRRLDLAAGVISHPEVLFLDEPTTGLDPSSRARMWDVIRGLVAEGTTTLLTTQYLDEADALADSIVVIDQGRAVANDTPANLKAAVGGARLELRLAAPVESARAALAPFAAGNVTVSADGRELSAAVVPEHGLTGAAVRALDAAGADVDSVSLREPSLDDVFFSIVNRRAARGDASMEASDGPR